MGILYDVYIKHASIENFTKKEFRTSESVSSKKQKESQYRKE